MWHFDQIPHKYKIRCLNNFWGIYLDKIYSVRNVLAQQVITFWLSVHNIYQQFQCTFNCTSFQNRAFESWLPAWWWLYEMHLESHSEPGSPSANIPSPSRWAAMCWEWDAVMFRCFMFLPVRNFLTSAKPEKKNILTNPQPLRIFCHLSAWNKQKQIMCFTHRTFFYVLTPGLTAVL